MKQGSKARAQVIRTPRPSRRWLLELLWNLSVHRISLRYRETLLGYGWILLQPVALTVIFNYIHRVAEIPTGETPYPLFVATGLVAWSFTSLVITQSANSIGSHQVLLKRVALPKVLFPLSSVVSSLADLAVTLILLVGLFVYYRFTPPWTSPLAILVLGVHLALLIGIGCFVSLANVFLRDMGQAVPHLLWLWFFASPVFYPVSMVPDEFRVLAKWNPMTGIIEGYRSVLLLGQPPLPDLFLPTVLVTAFILAAGWVCFRRFEWIITDML